MNSFEVAMMYLAVKAHFTQEKYDYFKYNGKVNFKHNTLLNRRDHYWFEKLTRKHKDPAELLDFLVANRMLNSRWVGDLFNADAQETYFEFKSYKESLSYKFEQELRKIPDIMNAFRHQKNNYPPILKLHISKDISIMTLTILNDLIRYHDKFDKFLGKDDIIWDHLRLPCLKLISFLEYDKDKIKTILREKINGRSSSKRQETSITARSTAKENPKS